MPTLTTVHEGYNLFSTTIGEHVVETDIPLSMGGADRAPTAPQLFIASLGACIASFVVSYCQRVGVDITDLAVDFDFELEEKPIRLTALKATVRLPHATLGDRLDAVRRAAEQCTLHHTLELFEGLTVEVKDAVAAD